MEVHNASYSLLTNFEVMRYLQEIKDSQKKSGLRNLATITYETLQYLEGTPCLNQNRNSIENFLKAIDKFNLTEIEYQMIINDPPTTPLHIQLIIDDSEERFTEKQIKEILHIVQNNLL